MIQPPRIHAGATRWSIGAALAISLLSAACTPARKVSAEVRAVQLALERETGRDVVGITLPNPTHLNVNVVNSRLKKLPDVERQAKAARLAKVAYNAYAFRSQLKSVRVAFVVVDMFIGIVTTNDASDAFTFDARELEPSQNNNSPTAALSQQPRRLAARH